MWKSSRNCDVPVVGIRNLGEVVSQVPRHVGAGHYSWVYERCWVPGWPAVIPVERGRDALVQGGEGLHEPETGGVGPASGQGAVCRVENPDRSAGHGLGRDLKGQACSRIV